MQIFRLALTTAILSAALLGSASFAGAQVSPGVGGPRSIAELALLSNLLVHHYACTADIILVGSQREIKFEVLPSVKGQNAPEQTIQLQNDKLVVSANAQMLTLEWTRLGRAVATVQTMIQDSPARNYVLISIDPSNPEQQSQISCDAITFAQAGPK